MLFNTNVKSRLQESHKQAIYMFPITLFTYGFFSGITSLETVISQEFNIPVSTVVFIITLPSFLELIFGIFSSRYSEKYNIYFIGILGTIIYIISMVGVYLSTTLFWFVFNICILSSIAKSMILITTLPVIYQWFEEHPAKGTFISSLGSYIGWIIFPLITNYIQKYNWRDIFLYNGIASIILFPSILLLKRKYDLPPITSKFTNWSFFKSIRIKLLIFFSMIYSLVHYVPVYYLYIWSKGLGNSNDQSALLVSINAFASVIFGLLGSILSDHLKKYHLLSIIVLILESISFFIMRYTFDYGIQILMSILLSFSCGMYYSLFQSILVRSIKDLSYITTINSIVWLLQGIMLYSGVYMIGFIHEQTGSWDIPLIICFICSSIGIFGIIIDWIFKN